MILEFLALLLISVLLFYKWAVSTYHYWDKRGVISDKPKYPLLGSLAKVILRKKAMLDVVVDLYNMHDGKVFGIFDQRTPMLLIRDPDLLKQIAIKDFDHFVNHRSIFTNDDDGQFFGSSLFMMQDSKWKDMRSTLSPAFTSSKMRYMFQLMNQVAQDIVAHFKKDPSVSTNEGLEVDFKSYCTRFSNDIIASTAFGIQVNSLEQKDNEFYCMGKKVTAFTYWMNLKLFVYSNFRVIYKFLNLKIFDKQSNDYFMRLVLNGMKYRKEHNITRPDMINMLMEAQGMVESDNPKTHNREWSDMDIVAQCFLFFFAGIETVSVLMAFTAQELLENPKVKAKLYQEIDEVNQKLDGKSLTYEVLQGMKYMDMVISEVLRKWPPSVAVDRVCNRDITLESDDFRLNIKKGDCIWMPVAGFHRDPKYYPNPMKFDPERFSEENKEKIHPLTYIPFGVGPRNCIGSRFALMEAKTIIFYMVREFHLEVGKKTSIPLKLSANGINLKPEKGLWLTIRSRAKV